MAEVPVDLLAARLLLHRLSKESAHLTPEGVARMRAGWADLPQDERAKREADLALEARDDSITVALLVAAMIEDLRRAQ